MLTSASFVQSLAEPGQTPVNRAPIHETYRRSHSGATSSGISGLNRSSPP